MAKEQPERKDENAKDENGAHPENAAEANEQQESEEGQEKTKNYEELKEHMLRIAAEFDNYKKRIKKEMDGAENLGKASLVKNMLPVIDEFELAILALNDAKDRNVAKGIEMLYSNFVDVLKKEGLEVIAANGLFDPYKHEIIMTRESEKKDGTILEVVKKGYMFGNRMLRPAAVIVSSEKKKSDDRNE